MSEYIFKYTQFLGKFFIRQSADQKPLKVVFDCSNGATGTILGKLFQDKVKSGKVKAILINQNPNGNFPAHGPNPLVKGAKNDLKKAVLKNKADLGVIFDGDGDRAFFIDDKGRFVDPDEIAYLLIWSLKPKKVVYDVRTGWLVRKMENACPQCYAKRCRRRKCLPVGDVPKGQKMEISESRVGHYFIKKLMREKDINFGCEQSGHYYFKKFFYADSGILAAIEVINAVSKLPYKFSDFIDLLPRYFRSGELNIKIKRKKPARNETQSVAGGENGKSSNDDKKLFKKIEQKYKKQKVKISYLDGLSMEFSVWWFNLRASNTEPLVRLNVEAINKKTLAKQTKILLRLLQKSTNN